MKRLIIIIIPLIPLIFTAKAQTMVSDTTYFLKQGGGYTRVVSYRNSATTSAATTTRVIDSSAALRVSINTKQPIGSYLVAADITGKLNKTDTSAMLSAYQTAINGKQAVGNYASGVTNTGDNSANSTYANDFRAANFIAGTNYLAPNGSAAALTNFPTLNQNTSGSAASLSAPLTFTNGGQVGTQAASASSGTVAVTMNTSIVTVTPSNAITFTSSGGTVGQRCTFIITTSGVSSFVITFGSGFKASATLATGTTTGKIFCVSFIFSNSLWTETGRTAAM